jgi:hypothetical protein
MKPDHMFLSMRRGVKIGLVLTAMLHVGFVLATSLDDELLEDVVVAGNDADLEFMIASVMAISPATCNLEGKTRRLVPMLTVNDRRHTLSQ